MPAPFEPAPAEPAGLDALAAEDELLPDVVAGLPVAAVLDVPGVAPPLAGVEADDGQVGAREPEPAVAPEPVALAAPELESDVAVAVAVDPVPLGAELMSAPLAFAVLTVAPGAEQPVVLLLALAPLPRCDTVLLVPPQALKLVVATIPVDTEDASCRTVFVSAIRLTPPVVTGARSELVGAVATPLADVPLDVTDPWRWPLAASVPPRAAADPERRLAATR